MNDNPSDGISAKRRYKKRALVFIILSSIIFIIFFSMLQSVLQTRARKEQEHNLDRFFSSTFSNLNNNIHEVNSLRDAFNQNNITMLNDLVMAYSGEKYEELSTLSPDEQSDLLYSASYSMQNCAWLLVVNRDADILISTSPKNNGLNILQDGETELTADQFHDLCDGKVDHLVVESPYEGSDVYKGKQLYLYCKPIPGTYGQEGYKYFFLAFTSDIIDATVSRLSDLSVWLNTSNIGNNGSVFMVDAENDTIRYGIFRGEDVSGKKASELGLHAELLQDRYLGDADISGVPCYVSARQYSSSMFGSKNYIVAAIPLRDVYGANKSVILWNCCLFLIFLVLMIAYAAFVRSDTLKKKEGLKGIPLFRQKGRRIYFSRTLAGKILPIVFLSSFLVYLASFYFQALMKLSDAFSESVSLEKEISRNIEEGASLQSDFDDYYEFQYISRAQLLSFVISLHGDEYFDFDNEANDVRTAGSIDANGNRDIIRDNYRNPVNVINSSYALAELCTKNNIEEIYLISDTGVTLATSSSYWNFSLSNDQNAQSYEFWDILDGKQLSIVQGPMISDEGHLSQFIGCPQSYYTCLDDEGRTKFMCYTDYLNQQNGTYTGNEITRHTGLIQLELNPTDESSMLNNANAQYVLSNTKISNDGFLIAFQYNDDLEDYDVIYTPLPDMKDKTSTELGLSEMAFSGDYNGFQYLNGIRYLQSLRKAGDYYIATAMPMEKLYEGISGISLFCALFSLAVMLLILVYTVFYFDDMDDDELYREEMDPLAIFGHWSAARSAKPGNPFHQFESIVKNSLIILGIVFLLSIIYDAQRYGNNSAIFYILKGEWDKGVHIFSLSACFVIIIVSSIILKFTSHLAYLIAAAFGNRVLTMIRLFVSLAKTVIIGLILFYCLFLLGIDATRLLASAGILSVVVGLGAQSLLGDVLAGIFIVMEGSLHVGDYVTIEGVRGIVTEIGLRTTRYEDINQNIRIIRNNEIKSLSNMSMKYSVILYNIPVPYEEDFPKIRKILNEEFIDLYEDHRFLKSIPVCQGIEHLGESSVELRVRFMCEEKDRYDVQRFMYDEIMRIFRENNITVPFNQLDIHVGRELTDGSIPGEAPRED
ncbi:MAG: mechanosensitive ion channel family protein [Lachnospiraceae bacterium]|nr:mechanosensitive ion channel family protein [Lachnospiraceae bacterium]